MDLIGEMKKAFRKEANKEIARKQARYMRDQFPFLGLPKPLRNQLQKPLFRVWQPGRKELLAAVQELFALKEREYGYAAIDLLQKWQSLLLEKDLFFLKKLIQTKSWWDTVDLLASRHVGQLILTHPSCVEELDRWIEDKDLWVRRSALIAQLYWKDKSDDARLFRYILAQANEKDFFIRKAIGWALRQRSKSNSFVTKNFLQEHGHRLSPLSVREAML